MLEIPKAPIDKCPHCGSDNGFYTKDTVKAGHLRYFYNYDGEEADNGDMWDSVRVEQGKYAYCNECHKRLFPITDYK
jgi:hypothetical protein